MDWYEFVVSTAVVVFGVLTLIALANVKRGGIAVWGGLCIAFTVLWIKLFMESNPVGIIDGAMVNGFLVGSLIGLAFWICAFAGPMPFRK
jgi:hypothetical protein